MVKIVSFMVHLFYHNKKKLKAVICEEQDLGVGKLIFLISLVILFDFFNHMCMIL